MKNHNTDSEIRRALHNKKLRRYHTCNKTLVIDELGLSHARARIDIAVINGCVHGYEIKSSVDTLNRLPRQIGIYQECLEKLTIVSAENHLDEVMNMAPDWCGIMSAKKGTRGAIHFNSIRQSKKNPYLQTVKLAHLLWRDEAKQILETFNVSRSVLRKPRNALYKELALLMSEREITKHIKSFMSSRQQWRDHQVFA